VSPASESAARRRRRRLEIAVSVAALIAIFVWSEGLLRRRIGPESALGPEARYAGPSATVELREVPVVVEGVGTVRAVEEAAVSARVVAVVAAVGVRVGDRVRRGQTLVELASPDLAAQDAAGAAAIRAAEVALAQAQRDYDRADYLYAREAATRVEWERARTALDQARAGLGQARGTAGAAAAAAGFARIAAPFDGVVTERNLDPGDLATPGTVILRIADDRAFRLEAVLDERVALGLRPGDPAEVAIDALDLTRATALAEVAPAAGAAHTSLVKADLPRTDGLRSGQFGRLRVQTGVREALVVPAQAVRRVGAVASLRVIAADGSAQTRAVRLGATLADGGIEILSGVDASERVAVGP
jgi:RND family efflux transporter MFP subunit